MTEPIKKSLVAYFSKAGEQYGVGNVAEGNTAVAAKIIAQKTYADIFEIKPKIDNYPAGYTALTEYAKNKKLQNARPELDSEVDDFSEYSVIFIGYPNWWSDLPMPVYTFLEKYDFTGKEVYPFCTHEGSGIGNTVQKIRNTIPNALRVNDGFEIYGHIAQNDRAETENRISKWLGI